MTIEKFYEDKKEPAQAATSAGEKLERTTKISAYDEYITIPVVVYTELIRESGLLEIVKRVLTEKRFKYLSDKVGAISAALGLPYGEDDD